MRNGALRISIIYILVSLIWIALSDRILYLFHDKFSPNIYLAINSGKGFFFVIITGMLLYKLIMVDKKKLVESQKQSRMSDGENKRLAGIIRRVNNMIIITDTDNLITWVNDAFTEYTGYLFTDLIGKRPSTVLCGTDTCRETIEEILGKKKALEKFSTDIGIYTKCGEFFWVSGEFTPLFDEDNTHTGYISVYNNITWRKEKEQETVRQNDKLKEIAWLSSHEVRRPLANIMGLINLLKRTPDIDEKLEIVDRVNRSAEELDEIVHVINSKITTEFEITQES